ncbi:MAG TPA: hypothetical protein VJY42_00055 [Candidatus Methanomethylophilaceae archaeon]|nr:hypothetical protein [Candidatus Methanomethylophilaceae archaeon]
MKKYVVNDSELSIQEIVESIIELNSEMCNFWSDAIGWAPIEAAELLSKSRLDWQVSLTQYLEHWVAEIDDDNSASLILAWTNLGSIVEGTIKLALSVHYKDYMKSPDKVKAWGKDKSPDELQLEKLKVFSNGKLWEKDDSWNEWISSIQKRRNAIHAFEDRELGDFKEFYDNLGTYLKFLTHIDGRLPYPDHRHESNNFY